MTSDWNEPAGGQSSSWDEPAGEQATKWDEGTAAVDEIAAEEVVGRQYGTVKVSPPARETLNLIFAPDLQIGSAGLKRGLASLSGMSAPRTGELTCSSYLSLESLTKV